MRRCVIINPGSGSFEDRERIERGLGELGSIDVFETRHPGHARELAARAVRDRYDVIIAAGGDGTVSEVVCGMQVDFTRSTLGLLPMGTGNDLARTLGVSPELDEAIKVIAEGRVRRIDLARIDRPHDNHLVNVSASGFSSLVGEAISAEAKKAWGPLAYLTSAVSVLPELEAHQTVLRFDHDEEITVDLFNLVVANGRFVAGGIPIAPSARIDDGLLDIVIVKAAPLLSLAPLAAKILAGQHLDDPNVIHRRVSRVSVRSPLGLWFNRDGELVDDKPFTMTVEPGRLKVFVGPDF